MIYATRLRESGPFLVDSDDLFELDALVNSEWERLGKHEQELIEKEIQRMTAENWPGGQEKIAQRARSVVEGYRRRSLTIFLPGGQKLAAKTFAEAARHDELIQQRAWAFDLKMQRGDVQLQVELGRYGDTIEIEATPEGSEDARELFAATRDWLHKVRVPAWQRVWAAAAAPLVWPLYLALVAWIVSGALTSNNRGVLIAEAHRLLKNGVTAAEQSKAIELLLALDSGYNVGAGPRGMTGRGWIIVVYGAAIALAASVPPKTTIGIGRGRSALRWWRIWTRFVGVTVPMMIFGNLVWPQVQQLVSSVWGH